MTKFVSNAPLSYLVMLVLVGATACTSTTQPDPGSSTSVAKPTVSATTPSLTSPPSEAQLSFASQPITLTVGNAVSTAEGAPTYIFEVSTNPAFSSFVSRTTGVAEGAGGRTSLTLSKLAGATTYYWRALITAAGESGPVSSVAVFTIGPEVVLQAPELLTPNAGSNVSDRPVLVLKNAQRTGPAGELLYEVEVSEQASFATTAYSAFVPERDGGTTEHTVGSALDADKTYYWRARAESQSAKIVGPYSAVSSFKVTNGLDLRTAEIVIGPKNIADWQETARITDAFFDPIGEQLCILHTRLGAWPPAVFADDGTTTEGNQWVFANIKGKWYGGAADYYRPGQACKGLNAESIGRDAFYQTPGSPAYSWQPEPGEIFAVMVSTPARAWPSYATYDERSDIVFIRWP